MRLHVTNGDSASSILETSAVPGTALPWADVLHDGPVPGGLTLAQMSEIRAAFLAAHFNDLDLDTVHQSFVARDKKIGASAEYDETTLWFEHDLYDQLQILQILDWYHQHPLTDGKLTMICIDRFQGVENFYGLGQLNAAQLASLDPTRSAVSKAQIELGARGWRAFTDSDPQALLSYIDSDTAALPFLASAIERLLEEYPGVKDGLSRSQRQVLQLVADGTDSPGTLFSAHQRTEAAPYMGDWSYFKILEGLANAAKPALRATGDVDFIYSHSHSQPSRDAFLQQTLALTDFGFELLAGDVDWVSENGIDVSYGGVHLTGEPDWRFDPEERSIVTR